MFCYLTPGTDEVSMGMVKRVLYTATGGSCRDPEVVSWSRNKTGGMNSNQCFEDPYRDLQNILCFEPDETEFA